MQQWQRWNFLYSLCAGFPQPNVTWYHHGQPLGSGEFWDVYSKDGYHYLANSDSSFLDCEEIVCRVENDSGFIQSVLQLSKKGNLWYFWCFFYLPYLHFGCICTLSAFSQLLCQITSDSLHWRWCKWINSCRNKSEGI